MIWLAVGCHLYRWLAACVAQGVFTSYWLVFGAEQIGYQPWLRLMVLIGTFG